VKRLHAQIVDDIISERRGFLPGAHPDRERVAKNLNGALLVDGLDDEQAALILSTLPGDTRGFYLAPLDKGLSGAAVFAGRYVRPNGTKSKPFVLKVGAREKIRREAEAVLQIVAPTIRGVAMPVVRYGPSRGLIVQDLVGLGDRGVIDSLRNVARTDDGAASVVDRLLRDRLSPWYVGGRSARRSRETWGTLFAAYLRKGPCDAEGLLPDGWQGYPAWAEAMGYLTPQEVFGKVNRLAAKTFTTFTCPVHGDLHTQNVLVETDGGGGRDCWLIDFGWTRNAGTPLVDLVMLECSLKFLALPMRAELGGLCRLEARLAREATPELETGYTPYGVEIRRVLEAIYEVRRFALNDLGFAFADYLRGLLLMTYSLMTHSGLNRPFVLASAHLLSEVVE